jgi:hypothetical protein
MYKLFVEQTQKVEESKASKERSAMAAWIEKIVKQMRSKNPSHRPSPQNIL